MRVLALGGLIAVAAGAVYFFAAPRPGDVYAMPVSEAYAKLNSVRFEPSGTAMFYRLDTTVVGNGKNKVVWEGSGSMSHRRCDLDLAPAPEKPAETLVTVTCEGGSAGSGAAAGMEHNMMRMRVIEMVDATLTGREFNQAKAMGSTASRWPGDGVDGSLAHAQAEALKMDAGMRKMTREMKKEAEANRFNEPVDSDFSSPSTE